MLDQIYRVIVTVNLNAIMLCFTKIVSSAQIDFLQKNLVRKYMNDVTVNHSILNFGAEFL